MRGIPGSIFILFLIFIILVEVLAFISMLQLLPKTGKRKVFSTIYWLLSTALLGIWLVAFLNPASIRQTENYQFFYFVISVSILNLIPKLILSISFILALLSQLFKANTSAKIIQMSGLIISFGILLSIGAGISWERLIIRIEKEEITLTELPEELDGLKIVQISDIHLGSFQSDDFLKKCVAEINMQEPDFVLFTGDLVNNYYSESIGFDDELKAIKAKHGKFAILGNHDYGDYSSWETEAAKQENSNQLRAAIEKGGFRLLLNSSSEIELRDTSLYIIGVENWGHPPFPQYAKLNEAITQIPNKAFKILLTHDPAHWEEKVIPESNIQLTLSGHTHAAQTGVKLAGIEFSPMYFMQKYWGGLYQSKNRHLYVNRGIGCVGILGRVDMRPEITVLTLRSNSIKLDRK